jgi:hypothetical protein
MSEPDLFDTARVRMNGKCETVDMREAQMVCGYFIGRLKDNPCCKRCGHSWAAHWPEVRQSQRVVRIAEVCSVCAYPLDSGQHTDHCGGYSPCSR